MICMRYCALMVTSDRYMFDIIMNKICRLESLRNVLTLKLKISNFRPILCTGVRLPNRSAFNFINCKRMILVLF